jgi:hypothetical protein
MRAPHRLATSSQASIGVEGCINVSFQLVIGGVARGSAGVSAAGRPACTRNRLGSTGGELSGRIPCRGMSPIRLEASLLQKDVSTDLRQGIGEL